ncbi:hypothetical protein ACFQE5_21650 [Pseudonocardia hispaniensis]|uniref:Uncharacterized protein n=1 Tax=Pseudonocardia hispaniensis TaxID=904933 RepID=A0ABW1J8R1_9PSEU
MSENNDRPLGRPEENTPLRPVVELTAEWATAVAQEFVDLVWREQERGLEPLPPPVDECWVGQDLAVYIRYRIGDWRLGRRIPDPHIDPTSGGYALSAREQGFYFFHDLYSPPPREFTDRLGYEWYQCGPEPEPERSWRYAVEEQPRIATVREYHDPDAER